MTNALVAEHKHADAEDVSVHLIKHVSFTLGNETYAINAARVNEVLRYTEVTPVPGAPAFILGIINLRGNVVTVINGRGVFGLPNHAVSEQSRIIVVEIEDFALGIVVDKVSAIVDLNAQEIEIPPATGNEAGARFIQGVYNEDDELMILVDFSRVTELLPR
ncbi:chemotaxis protein CheW [Pseudohongiella sp.]|uniref:CheW-like domain-containing protein n=1 Tax=marine sediment metagenome TaxID=412755 RepID=A0A0F9W7F4_9ZZZZ|nr:chemotaxis protein CheW [Pseudohongiella sp.]HDZ09411.1 purine-binding chemotaxis protein CheW [Pseudohongiella sp.]HEA63334.1 purine-binding chemotaxis protein CheW [Pseudohongiella sp.]